MKTTIELPDDLFKEIKIRSVREGRKLKDTMAELLRKGLETPEPQPRATVPHTLPLAPTKKLAEPAPSPVLDQQAWCDWVKELDLQMDLEQLEKAG